MEFHPEPSSDLTLQTHAVHDKKINSKPRYITNYWTEVMRLFKSTKLKLYIFLWPISLDLHIIMKA